MDRILNLKHHGYNSLKNDSIIMNLKNKTATMNKAHEVDS